MCGGSFWRYGSQAASPCPSSPQEAKGNHQQRPPTSPRCSPVGSSSAGVICPLPVSSWGEPISCSYQPASSEGLSAVCSTLFHVPPLQVRSQPPGSHPVHLQLTMMVPTTAAALPAPAQTGPWTHHGAKGCVRWGLADHWRAAPGERGQHAMSRMPGGTDSKGWKGWYFKWEERFLVQP